MNKFAIFAILVLGMSNVAVAQTTTPGPAGQPSPGTAAPAPAPAPISTTPGGTLNTPTVRGKQIDDVLLQPPRIKRRAGPLRGTPIIAGNPDIRVDRSGEVITSEQP